MDADDDPDRAKLLAALRAKFDTDLGVKQPAPLPLLPPDDPAVPWRPTPADVEFLRGLRLSAE